MAGENTPDFMVLDEAGSVIKASDEVTEGLDIEQNVVTSSETPQVEDLPPWKHSVTPPQDYMEDGQSQRGIRTL